MTGETNSTTYSDTDIQSYIEAYPIIKEDCYEEQIIGYVTLGLLQYPIVDYDLHATAAQVWEEKQAVLASDGSWDVSGPGGGFQKSQQYEQYGERMRYHLARRYVQSIAIKAAQAACEYRSTPCPLVINES
jgi:hypothetical protein